MKNIIALLVLLFAAQSFAGSRGFDVYVVGNLNPVEVRLFIDGGWRSFDFPPGGGVDSSYSYWSVGWVDAPYVGSWQVNGETDYVFSQVATDFGWDGGYEQYLRRAIYVACRGALLDEDGDGILIMYDSDANGDGIPDNLNYSPARVYVGGDSLQAATNTVYLSGANRFDRVEAWPDRAALATARINEYSRSIVWRCVLFDNQGEPFRDNSGGIITFPVIPQWRKQSELYEVTP